MSEIERIYYDLDDYTDMPETNEAYKKMSNAMGRENILKYDYEIMGYAAASQKQGFIRGFQFAVSLLMCGRNTELPHVKGGVTV